VKWFYILKVCFGGRPVNPSFGAGTNRPRGLNLLDIEETIVQIHWRLARVTIENKPYQEVLAIYDRPHTFFYLAPPYYGIKAYRLNFEPADFETLARSLAGLKGKFLMSLNDRPEVKRIFAGFTIKPVTLKYSVSPKPSSRDSLRRELLISNY